MKKDSDLKIVIIGVAITAILLGLIFGLDFRNEYEAPKETMVYDAKIGSFVHDGGTPCLNIY